MKDCPPPRFWVRAFSHSFTRKCLSDFNRNARNLPRSASAKRRYFFSSRRAKNSWSGPGHHADSAPVGERKRKPDTSKCGTAFPAPPARPAPSSAPPPALRSSGSSQKRRDWGWQKQGLPPNSHWARLNLAQPARQDHRSDEVSVLVRIEAAVHRESRPSQ